MLKVRNRRRKNLHFETVKELLQLRADKRFLLAAHGAPLSSERQHIEIMKQLNEEFGEEDA